MRSWGQVQVLWRTTNGYGRLLRCQFCLPSYETAIACSTAHMQQGQREGADNSKDPVLKSFTPITLIATLVTVILMPAAALADSNGPTLPASNTIFMSPSNVTQVKTILVPAPQNMCTRFYQAHPDLTVAQPGLALAPCQLEIHVTLGLARDTGSTTPLQTGRLLGVWKVHHARTAFFTDSCINPDCSYLIDSVGIYTCSSWFGGCGNWKNTVTWSYEYNGNYIYLYGPSPKCTSESYTPYSQNITYCGASNNGGQGSGYMNFGDNWTVNGYGGSCTLYQRQPIDTYGNLLTPSAGSTGINIDC